LGYIAYGLKDWEITVAGAAGVGGGCNVDVLIRGGFVKEAGEVATRDRDVAGTVAVAGLRLRWLALEYGL